MAKVLRCKDTGQERENCPFVTSGETAQGVLLKFTVHAQAAYGLASPEETKVVELEGDLWHVKVSRDDCNCHLELSAPNAGRTADRVIVEIPQGRDFVRAREQLQGEGGYASGCQTRSMISPRHFA